MTPSARAASMSALVGAGMNLGHAARLNPATKASFANALSALVLGAGFAGVAGRPTSCFFTFTTLPPALPFAGLGVTVGAVLVKSGSTAGLLAVGVTKPPAGFAASSFFTSFSASLNKAAPALSAGLWSTVTGATVGVATLVSAGLLAAASAASRAAFSASVNGRGLLVSFAMVLPHKFNVVLPCLFSAQLRLPYMA